MRDGTAEERHPPALDPEYGRSVRPPREHEPALEPEPLVRHGRRVERVARLGGGVEERRRRPWPYLRRLLPQVGDDALPEPSRVPLDPVRMPVRRQRRRRQILEGAGASRRRFLERNRVAGVGEKRDPWGSETQPTFCGWVGSKLAHSIRQSESGEDRNGLASFDLDSVDLIFARARKPSVALLSRLAWAACSTRATLPVAGILGVTSQRRSKLPVAHDRLCTQRSVPRGSRCHRRQALACRPSRNRSLHAARGRHRELASVTRSGGQSKPNEQPAALQHT
jgi:hypothetical protein